MKAIENSYNIEKKQIKVLIKSIYHPCKNEYSYNLFFSPTDVGYEILYLFFQKLCAQFYISVWNTHTFDCQEEIELTSAFCVYANRKILKKHFVIGNKEECVIDYLSLKRQITSQISSLCGLTFTGFRCLFIQDESGKELFASSKNLGIEYKLLEGLKNCINSNDGALDYSSRWDFKQKYRLLNLYRYSLVVEKMVKENAINVDDFIPILDKNDLVDFYTDKKKLYWAEPQTLFEEDIYPLNLAYMAGNSELMFYLLKMGASKFSVGRGVRMDGSSMQSDFVVFMLEKAKDTSEFALIMTFINNHSEQIEKETKIVTKGNTHSLRECINSSGGENIIRAWYKCALRLQDIKCLELLLKRYNKQILGLLNNINPYSGNFLSQEKEKPLVDMNIEINKYIQENIVPFIQSAQFTHTYKDNGIWGYDALTGAPIYEKDLYV